MDRHFPDEAAQEANAPIKMSDLLLWFALSILLVVVWSVTGYAQQFLSEKPLVPTSESRMWIQGETSVAPYECRARKVYGFGVLKKGTVDGESENEPSVEVQVPVRSLDCGKKAMNRDMYEALKEDKYPNIHYELTGLTTEWKNSSTSLDTSGWLSIRARGRLSIAGSTRTVNMKVSGKHIGDKNIRVQGKKRLNMKKYGIDPPTALFGLVKVGDSLTVHYDLYTTPVDTLPSSELEQRFESSR